MTCKDCFSYLACKQWMDWQNDDWDYLRDEYPNNKNAHIFCGQFHYKSKVVELPEKFYLVESDFDSMFGDDYWIRTIKIGNNRIFTDKSKAEAKLKELNNND